MIDLRSIAVIVPTLNAGSEWDVLEKSIKAQGISAHQVLIVDSESTDDTVERAGRCGFQVAVIPRPEFNHGGTRQWALKFFPGAEIVVFLTQDAFLANGIALERLAAAFEEPKVAAAFGRQLPRPSAGSFEMHARLFNYPPRSSIRSLTSRDTLGIKAIFFSNSFGAYRRKVLDDLGGFPTNVILGEDTVVAARMLLAGWSIAYVAEAQAYHSHRYSAIEEFKRYFDTGVLHSKEQWLLSEFGRAHGEGWRFIRSELNYLWRNDPTKIPVSVWRMALKFGGYRLGALERKLSWRLKRRLSMHHRFWMGDEPKECL